MGREYSKEERQGRSRLSRRSSWFARTKTNDRHLVLLVAFDVPPSPPFLWSSSISRYYGGISRGFQALTESKQPRGGTPSACSVAPDAGATPCCVPLEQILCVFLTRDRGGVGCREHATNHSPPPREDEISGNRERRVIDRLCCCI